MSALRLFDRFRNLLDVSWASISDGQTLKRSGTNIIGYTPGGGSGDVVGPAVAADNDVAVFSGTTGKLIKTTALQTSTIAGHVTGPGSAVSGNIASYNGTTGKIIADGAKLAADLVVGPASSVDSEVALFSGLGGKTVKRATGTGAVRVANGVYQTPVSDVGSVIQTVEATVTTEVLTTIVVPTLPFTVSNGDPLMSAVITPYYSNSKIQITASGYASLYRNPSGIGDGIIWLCASGTTNWLADTWPYGYSDNAAVHWILRYTHTPGAGARTYTLRMCQGSVFPSGANSMSMYINGFNFVSVGYKPVTTLTLQEIKV